MNKTLRFSLLCILAMLCGGMTGIKASTVDDLVPITENYVLVCDQLGARPGAGALFGDDHFLDFGGSTATNKGEVNLSVVDGNDGYVTQEIVDKYGADYPDAHKNFLRLKNAQDKIAVSLVAGTKLIIFVQGNNKSGTAARIPRISKNSSLDEALNDAPDVDHASVVSGFRWEYTVEEDGVYYLGSYNGDMFVSFIIAEVPGNNPPAPADDVLPLTLTFPSYNDESISAYTKEWTATVDGKVWTLNGFNNNANKWNSVKCGQKAVDQTATLTSPAIQAEVTNVVYSVAATKNVSSVTLTILNGDAEVSTTDITEKFVAGDVNIEVAGAKGYSYKLTINSTAGQNGSTEISKVAIYGAGQFVEKHIANTAETAYTVAQAIELIEAGEALADVVYVKGIISQVDSYNDNYKSINYWISDNGTTDSQFECYSGKGLNGADFESVDDVKVGATVIVKGTMKKYGDIYEFNASNELVSYEAPAAPAAELAEGNYFIKNVATGQYLTGANDWGTRASVANSGVEFTVAKLPEGGYSLLNTLITVNNKYLGSNLYTDSTTPDGGWTIAEAGDGIYTIALDGQYVAQGTAENVMFPVAVWASEVTDAAKWQFLTKEEAIAALEEASENNPLTATFLISNPGFNRNTSTAGWTVEASNRNLSGGANNNMCAESWQSAFNIRQTLTGVPEGEYILTAQAALTDYANLYDGADYPVVYANEASSIFNNMDEADRGTNMTTLSNSFLAGKYYVEPIHVIVFDGELTVGVKGTRTNTWCIWDNFDLTYVGKPANFDQLKSDYLRTKMAEVLQTLADEIAVANEMLADETKAEGKDELAAAIATAQAIYDGTTLTQAEYEAAVAALKEAEQAFVLANLPLKPGVYYVYNAFSDKFLSRGDAWGTRAVGDDYGLAINVTFENGAYLLQEVDNAVYYGDDFWMYADCSGNRIRSYELEATDGGFYLHNTARLDVDDNRIYIYLKDDADKYAIAGNAILGDNIDSEEQAVWQFLSVEERDALVAERELLQQESVIELLGASEDAITLGNTVDLTFATGSEWTFNAVRSGSNAVTNEFGTEVYQGTGSFTQQVTGLESGVYKVDVQAFYRDGWNADVAANYDLGYNLSLAYLQANDTKVQVMSWGEDRVDDGNPNSMAQAAELFAQGKYTNEGLVYVAEDGVLDLTVVVPSFNNGGWFIANKVSYTKLDVDESKLVVTWDMADGADSQGEASVSYLASNIDWSMGDNVVVASTATRTWNGITFTQFTVNEKKDNSRSVIDENYVEYAFTPGRYFTPQNVSFDIIKVGTGEPNIWVEFIDGEGNTITLAENQAIRRNNDTDETSINQTFAIEDAAKSPNAVALRIYIGKLATNKQVGIANVKIEGKLAKAFDESVLALLEQLQEEMGKTQAALDANPTSEYAESVKAVLVMAQEMVDNPDEQTVEGVEQMILALQMLQDLLNDETTGINSLKADLAGATIYTINGQKVNSGNLRKGIYVINGKKVVVK